MRWTRKSIIAEINRLHDAGEQLNYSAAEGNHLNLVRAAAWHYGTWRHAVESAGVNYESLSRYQRWNKARIVERINELHKQEQDLSWRAVSTEVDPPLAAAALRVNGFKSWREALAAAGIDVEKTARYQYWDEAKVIKAIRARKRAGEPMSSKSLQKSDQCLFCAARRRFGSWDAALAAAGLNVDKIRLRRHNSSLNAPRNKKETVVAAIAAKNGKVAAPKAVKALVGKSVVAKAASKPAASKPAKAATLQLSLEMPAAKTAKKSPAAKAATAAKATATKAAATKAPAKATAAKAAKAAVPQLPLDMPAAKKPAVKAPAKAPAKKAAVSRNGKATAPVKIATKAAPVKSTAKTVAAKAAPAKKAAVKGTAAKASSVKAATTSKIVAQSIAKKGPAKKVAAKKAPVAKPTAAKAAVKKTAVAKPAAGKAAAKKAVVAKPAAKKPAATKVAAKKAPAKRAAR
nr:histone protein [uncultured bacterium]